MDIKDKIIKSELIDWKKLKFIQSDDLKELSPEAKEKLKTSIKSNNFISSFKVWQSKDKLFCLDGKHRYNILLELEAEGAKIPGKLRADIIDCKDKKEASKLVLIYTSFYAQLLQEPLFEFIELNKLDIDSLIAQTNFENIDFSNYFLKGDLLSVEVSEHERTAPKSSADEYSLFELVMIHENKLKLVEVLKNVKEKYNLEKTEDALMRIINSYKLK